MPFAAAVVLGAVLGEHMDGWRVGINVAVYRQRQNQTPGFVDSAGESVEAHSTGELQLLSFTTIVYYRGMLEA